MSFDNDAETGQSGPDMDRGGCAEWGSAGPEYDGRYRLDIMRISLEI